MLCQCFSKVILYFLNVLEQTHLSKDDRYSSSQCVSPFQRVLELCEGFSLGKTRASKTALHTQQLHSGLLHSLVDTTDFSLGQCPFHVAVSDAVAVAGPVCPGEGQTTQGGK